jgi:hypothetical protein
MIADAIAQHTVFDRSGATARAVRWSSSSVKRRTSGFRIHVLSALGVVPRKSVWKRAK